MRNVLLTFFGEMCNSEHLADCSQRISWPFQDNDRWHGMNCRNDTAENTCHEIKWSTTPLPGLTETKYYLTRAERTLLFWKQKKIPPVLTVEYRGVRAMVIEAGCDHPGNALWKVLNYVFDPKTGPKHLPHRYDLLISGGGLHCSFADYVHLWYLKAAKALSLIRVFYSPVLWLELPHCLYYSNATGMTAKRNYASCDVHSSRRSRVESRLNNRRVPISPTRFISKGTAEVHDIAAPLNATERMHSCLFGDELHPSLVCYRTMTQVHINAMRAAIQFYVKPNQTVQELAAAEEARADSAEAAEGDNATLPAGLLKDVVKETTSGSDEVAGQRGDDFEDQVQGYSAFASLLFFFSFTIPLLWFISWRGRRTRRVN